MNSLYVVAIDIWDQLRKINRRISQPFSFNTIHGELCYRMYICNSKNEAKVWIDISSGEVGIHFGTTYNEFVNIISIADPNFNNKLKELILKILKEMSIHVNIN